MNANNDRKIVVIIGDPSKPDPVKLNGIFGEDDFDAIDRMKSALGKIGGYGFDYLSDHDCLAQDLINLRQKGKVHLVFNLCDEGFNNDPRMELHVPAILEFLNLPYTGAGPKCLAHCYDKSLVKGIAMDMKILVAEGFIIKPGEKLPEISMQFPLFVKPNFGDGSYGITEKNSVVHNIEEIYNAISVLKERFRYSGLILVEEFLQGKDLTFGIIGNPPNDFIVLPISEEDHQNIPVGSPQISSHETKWDPKSSGYYIGSRIAEIPKSIEDVIRQSSLRLFESLECRDYARFDWRLNKDGEPRLLDVNPNPGWCFDGHLAKVSNLAGISYSGMLELIIRAAERRYGLA